MQYDSYALRGMSPYICICIQKMARRLFGRCECVYMCVYIYAKNTAYISSEYNLCACICRCECNYMQKMARCLYGRCGCIHMYISICMHRYVPCLHIHADMSAMSVRSVWLYVHVYVYMQVCIHVYTHMRVGVHVYTEDGRSLYGRCYCLYMYI